MSDKREAIVALHRDRKSDSAIAKTLSIARFTVWKTLTRFNERGIYLIVQEVVDHAPKRSGKPRTGLNQ